MLAYAFAQGTATDPRRSALGLDSAFFSVEWRRTPWATLSNGAPSQQMLPVERSTAKSLTSLTERYDTNAKTAAKWKRRGSVTDRRICVATAIGGPLGPSARCLALERVGLDDPV
jgi:hypothetical protein